jgi:hypothetical protein
VVCWTSCPLLLECLAVEPQSKARETLKRLGYIVHEEVKEIEVQDIEIATLFHVFEHLSSPVEYFKNIEDQDSCWRWL